jgi:hypothetical protein
MLPLLESDELLRERAADHSTADHLRKELRFLAVPGVTDARYESGFARRKPRGNLG